MTARLVSTAGWAEAKGEKSKPGEQKRQPGLYRPPDGRKLKEKKASPESKNGSQACINRRMDGSERGEKQAPQRTDASLKLENDC